MIVGLDSGVLGGITNPNPKSQTTRDMIAWALRLRASGHTLLIPAVADYEVRRELIRNRNRASIAELDNVRTDTGNIHLPLTDRALLRAAQLWADVLNEGKPPTNDLAIDGDVLIMAQILDANFPEGAYIVATDNLRHFQGRVPADLWQNILP